MRIKRCQDPFTRRGFTLLEMILVMSVLTVLIGMLTITLLTALRVEVGSKVALDRLSLHSQLADQFRADAAQAAEAPERWQTYTAGPACLILHLCTGQHVVYRWEDNQLFRSEFPAAGTPTRLLVVARNKGQVSFGRTDPGKRLLVLRFEAPRDTNGKPSATEIAAAVGGALR